MNEETFFENISEHLNNQLPFVVYKKPFSFDVTALLQKDITLYKINDFSESGFVFSPFDSRKDVMITPYSKSRILKMSSETYSIVEKDQKTIKVRKDKQFHLDLIKKVLDAIEKGEFEKLVLSRKEIMDVPNIDVFQTLKRMLNNYNSAFVYCWFHPNVGLWLGATPETLMQVQGNRLSTMSLAGTQKYDGSKEVAWDDKEVNEQQLVTDHIYEVIKPHVNQIEVSESKTIKAGNLLHLKTDITGILSNNNESLQDLILSLHPTAAVCGLPKNEAMQFILNNENYNREFYSGFLGELNKEAKIESRFSKSNVENRAYTMQRRETHLFVNLRCMQLKDNQASVYVGGGITRESNPELEWEETVQKAKTIKSVIAF